MPTTFLLSLQAIAACLWIVGFPEETKLLLSKFKWGEGFLTLNSELLGAYAQCSDSASVVAAQQTFFDAWRQEREDRLALPAKAHGPQPDTPPADPNLTLPRLPPPARMPLHPVGTRQACWVRVDLLCCAGHLAAVASVVCGRFARVRGLTQKTHVPVCACAGAEASSSAWGEDDDEEGGSGSSSDGSLEENFNHRLRVAEADDPSDEDEDEDEDEEEEDEDRAQAGDTKEEECAKAGKSGAESEQ